MADEDDDYEVGYGKPPKHTQFQKGRSGNPNGRPKATKKTQKAILEDIANRQVTMSVSGKQTSVTMLEAVYLRLADGALKGEKGAIKTFIELLRENGYFDKMPPGVTFGVMRVKEPMNDGKAWSERAQANQRRAAELDRQGSAESPPEAKPKGVRVKLVKAKKTPS